MRLSQVQGFVAEGDVIGVDWAIGEGRHPLIFNLLGWPLPRTLRQGKGPERVGVTDELLDFEADIAYLRPPSLIVGIHPIPDADPTAVRDALTDVLAEANLARSAVGLAATIDVCRNDKAIRRLGLPVKTFDARRLRAVRVPMPSSTLLRHAPSARLGATSPELASREERAREQTRGTRSACEAAAVLAGGVGTTVIVGRHRTPVGTISIARRRPPAEVSIDLGPATTPRRSGTSADRSRR